MRRCVGEALSLCAPRPGGRVRLESTIATDVPEWVVGDDSRLRQTLVNLLNNGVKFTPAGTVTLHVSQAGNGVLRFRIHDTGIGIPREKLGDLFKPFSQIDASSTRQYGGTGLGLSICKRLIELMGGTISVESEAGHGSTFTFTIPAAAAGGARSLLPEATGEVFDRNLRVLIVEDIEVNQTLIRRMLEELGLESDVAGNGAECLRLLEGRSYDFLLMDLHMPVMDGFTATREIRRREREKGTTKRIHICALTANLMARDREACREAGMDDFLGKPLRIGDLRAALARRGKNPTIS